ncbi:MAG: hypothetical protein HOP12_07160 [Candidatus Eisenbacteria bacterium]|uniref:Gliding motility protein SprA N-terminal domain-containing protein n=1 Tax=Eiseniibacteriota bacterium TaxID=2212470 RepID=A0A849SJT1_UNCEI|nr:hypothetical protein [Candidatus Eisenbacteria bacterium]
MHTLIALPLSALLLAAPGIPALGWLKALRPKAAVPADTIPPPFRPASVFVLESRFLRAALPAIGPRPVALSIANDPRRVKVDFDATAGRVRYSIESSGVPLGSTARPTTAAFAADLRARTFEKLWRERAIEAVLSSTPAASGVVGGSRSGFSLPLPDVLPRPVRALLGSGSPAINVFGSANLSISGQSNWTNQQTGLLGQRRSLFPTLNVQQDLNIQVEGQLSDRVKVNLLQNSAFQIPLQNKIAINYKGDEDDLVQSLDLGNTNLTLPGTQFVSYSGRNEGLFGAKLATRMGPFDVTVLTSKQEGRSERASYAGGSNQQSPSIADLDYEKGTYFFLYDPNLEPWKFIDPPSIQLFLDEGSYLNTAGLVRARAYIDPTLAVTPSDSANMVRGNFRPLRPGAGGEYEVIPDLYGDRFLIIKLRSRVTGDGQMLAASYRYQGDVNGVRTGPMIAVGGDSIPEIDGTQSLRLKLLRSKSDSLRVVSNTELFDRTSPFVVLRDLELKNIYSLGGQGIDLKTFEMSIERGDDDPPEVTYLSGGQVLPYLELLGLDNYDETSVVTSGRFGHDGRVDVTTAPIQATRPLVDITSGLLYFKDLRPFAPRLTDADGAGPFDRAVSRLLSRRDSLVGPEDQPNGANRSIYDKRIVNRENDRRYWLNFKFTASRASSEIVLGRSNILESSEAVRVNGQTWRRDVDYRIDYDLGRITLIRSLGPSDQLNIDYAYAPLFAQAGRTLVGSAFSWEGRDKRVGGALMYESKGAQDLRPRLGEEPSRTIIGDLNTEWRFRPDWVTRLVDGLPGVRTTAPSEFYFNAEMGASFPNPNTRNEVYIDDMEGARDAVTLSMSPERWQWSSVPLRVGTQRVDAPGVERPRVNAEVHWFTPLTSILERDLRPYLLDQQGASNNHPALAISIPRRPAAASPTDTLWTGLTYVLDQQGLDLSRSQFIEVWVNDFRDAFRSDAPGGRLRGRNVKLHLDLGVVSEDQQRAPNVPPNGSLDSEDQAPLDGVLQVTTGTSPKNEDTGVDQQENGRENPTPAPDLVTAGGVDLNGDDFSLPNEAFRNDFDPRRWRGINGRENNRTRSDRIDTEDLNLNTGLDVSNDYFEYTIDLGLDPANDPFVVDSSYAEGARYVNNNDPIPAENGWRLYRIPISHVSRTQFGSPNLTLARHVRVWLDGVMEPDPDPSLPPLVGDNTGRPYVVLGDVSIVGSRWKAADLDTTQQLRGTTSTITTLNNTDNADIYSSPFDPGEQREGSRAVQRREQSIVLEFANLGPRDSLEVYRSFSIDEDYTRYGALNFFVTGFDVPGYVPGIDSLRYFVRFASDDRGTNYYEFRAPLPMRSDGKIDWRELRLELTELSALKLDPAYPPFGGDVFFRAPGPSRYPGSTIAIKGRPSFTRLRRISFGVVNEDPTRTFPAGQLWVNEIRALDVKRDTDRAQRVQINGRLSNLMSYNFNYNSRGPDFLSVGEQRGTGTESSALALGSTFDLHRFFEATGIVLPLGVQYQSNTLSPRFTAGDDVVRAGEVARRSESRTNNLGYSLGYSRAWSDRSNPFLRYTLGGITASLAQTRRQSISPSNADTSSSLSGAVNYQITPRSLVSFLIPGTKTKMFPLPERFYWNYAIATSEARTYARLPGSNGELAPSSFNSGRTASIDFGASTRPIDLIRHEFSARRNLTLPEDQREQLGFVNLGRVVAWRQSFESRLAPQRLGPWVRPIISLGSNYNQNNGPELSSDLGTRAVTNGMNLTVSLPLPFDRISTSALASRAPIGQISKADSAARDSVRRRGSLVPLWRRLAARLGNITTDSRLIRSSSHTRLDDAPDLLYMVGLSHDPGFQRDSSGLTSAANGNRTDQSDDWSSSANSRIDVGFGATLGSRLEVGSRRSISTGIRSRSDRLRFPDVEVNYGRVPEILQLKRVFNNPQFQTAYVRSTSTEYLNSDRPTRDTRTSEWRPLLKFSGDLKNGTRGELRIERRTTESNERYLVSLQRVDRFTDIQMSLNRSYSQGQKIVMFGKETTVRQRVDLGFTATYSRTSVEQRQPGIRLIQQLDDKDQMSANATGAYGFSDNVTGNLELGFRQDRNLLTTITTRSLRISARAQFTF